MYGAKFLLPWWLFWQSLTGFAQGHFSGLSLAPKIARQLNWQWADKDHRPIERASVLARVVEKVAHGKIVGTLSSALWLPYGAITEPNRVAGSFFKGMLQPILNPLLIVSYLFSDMQGAVSAFMHGERILTDRVRLCTHGTKAIVPTEHVYFLVDDGQINNLGQIIRILKGPAEKVQHYIDVSSCEPVPVALNECVSLLIERLNYLVQTAFYFDSYDYNLISYNCSGMTRMILESSGFGYEDLANLGLGGRFLRVPVQVKQKYEKEKDNVEMYLGKLRGLIIALEKKGKLDPLALDLVERFKPREDMVLQLFISAVRGGSRENLAEIKSALGTHSDILYNYLTGEKRQVSAKHQERLAYMFSNLTAEDVLSLKAEHKAFLELLEGR